MYANGPLYNLTSFCFSINVGPTSKTDTYFEVLIPLPIFSQQVEPPGYTSTLVLQFSPRKALPLSLRANSRTFRSMTFVYCPPQSRIATFSIFSLHAATFLGAAFGSSLSAAQNLPIEISIFNLHSKIHYFCHYIKNSAYFQYKNEQYSCFCI